MKGLSFIKDKKNKKVEDLFDVIIAESRVQEKSVPFERVIKQLRKKGKL